MDPTSGQGDQHPRNERDFFRIVMVATALGFGGAVGSLYSLRAGPGGFRFEITVGSFVAFVLGALVAWQYWRLLLKLTGRSKTDPAQTGSTTGRVTVTKFVLFSFILFAAGVGAFLYPLRYVSTERFPDIAQGLLLAFLFLGLLGILFWKVTRYLRDDR